MKKSLIIWAIILANFSIYAQNKDTVTQYHTNAAEQMLREEGQLTIGGYGNVDYNQPLNSDIRQNGKMDVHRLILLVGYHFNAKTSLITEIEYEHVEEVYIEQAFLNYRLNPRMNLRGGLLLTPMGITNLYHESPTFNGVERPLIDKYIAPTTWREIGAGISGTLPGLAAKYQAYVMNGFDGFDASATLSGKYGLRKGRQKAAESYISSPSFAARVEYYGILGMNLGFSAYLGKTQSSLYDGIDKDNETALERADSSVVGVSMLGLDMRYQTSGMHIKGQLYYTSLANTDEYNEFSAGNTGQNGLGSSMFGYYLEAGYDLLHARGEHQSQLIPFVRYSYYNTQQTMASGFTSNPAYAHQAITTGLTWKITRGSAVKSDIQFVRSEADQSFSRQLNLGVAFWF